MDKAENKINDLEYKKQKTTNQNNRKKTRDQKNTDSVSSLWDDFKRSNIHIIGVPEGEKKKKEIGNLLEKIMKENFHNPVREIEMQVSRKHKVPSKMDAKRPIPRQIIIKMPKVSAREKKLAIYRGIP